MGSALVVDGADRVWRAGILLVWQLVEDAREVCAARRTENQVHSTLYKRQSTVKTLLETEAYCRKCRTVPPEWISSMYACARVVLTCKVRERSAENQCSLLTREN